MTRVEFLKQLNEGGLLPAYLFLGGERLFHEELLEATVEKLLTPEEREFNFLRMNAGMIKGEDFAANLETGSLFGSTRVISLAEFENATGEIEEILVECLSQLVQGVYLIISAAKLDGRKKINQEIQKRIPVVDCNKLNANDVPFWIKQRAQKMGLDLTPEQARIIGERSGLELLRVRTELEKLAAFAGPKRALSNQELEDLIPGEPEPDIFGLIDAVAGRNPKIGLPKLEELLDSGENELKILATLSRQFRNIAAASEAKNRGITSRALADLIGINPYVAEKSFGQARYFSLPELQRILNRLLQADYRIKTGQREPRLELELAVVEITMK